ncbi:TPA: hypothetical protein L4G90_006130 [Pseudomonas aeruginosa]|nr:hypothetical protein [Pseudomonas aeruginosa]
MKIEMPKDDGAILPEDREQRVVIDGSGTLVLSKGAGRNHHRKRRKKFIDSKASCGLCLFRIAMAQIFHFCESRLAVQ